MPGWSFSLNLMLILPLNPASSASALSEPRYCYCFALIRTKALLVGRLVKGMANPW